MPNDIQLPPQNLDAERAVLGGILLSNEAADEIGFLKPEHFYGHVHGIVFGAFLYLREKRRSAVDAVTLAGELTRRKELAEVGGAGGLAALLDSVPLVSNVRHYANLVVRAFLNRQIIYAATESIRDAMDGQAEPAEVAARAEQRLHAVLEHGGAGTGQTVDQIMLSLWAVIDAGKPLGTPTGLKAIDEIIEGLKPQTLNVIAARPSMGKSALVGNIAVDFARRGIPVWYFSLEMGAVELAERFLATEATVPMHVIRQGPSMDEAQRGMLGTATESLCRLPLMIDDAPGRTITQIASAARLKRRQQNIGLVVVDYLQLIEPENRRDSREQQVAVISRGLKMLAKELEIPVLMVAQLNRMTEMRVSKRPQLSDMRESGAIEQDADTVMLVFRPSYYKGLENEEPDDDAKKRGGRKPAWVEGIDDPTYAEVIVAKNRSGKTGVAKLHWTGDITRFRDRDAPAEYEGNYEFQDRREF